MERFRRLGVHRDAHRNGVWCVSQAPKVDGCDFATGGADGVVTLWALKSGVETAADALGSHADAGEGANGNGDTTGKPVKKTGSNDDDLTPLTLVAKLKPHSLGVVGVSIAAEATVGASTSLDGTLMLWDAANPDAPATPVPGLSTNITETWAVAVSADGTRVVTAGAGGAVHLVNVLEENDKDKQVTSVNFDPAAKPGEAPMCLSVAFSPDGNRVAVGAQDGMVRVFEAESGKPVTELLKGHSGPVRSVSFVPGEDSLVTASDDGLVNYYDFAGAHLAISLRGHFGMVLSAVPSPCGKYVVTGSSDRKVKIWDRKLKEAIFTGSEHTDSVWGVAYASDGSRVISVSDDGCIAVVDSENADKVIA